MKKLFLFLTMGTVIMMLTASFVLREAPPKLYPELENYFKSIEIKEFKNEHANALVNLKDDISLSHSLYDDWNLIFYCSENTFRSQASQLFAQTLCYSKNHRKIKVFSAGHTSGEIDPRLIAYFSKIGYKVTRIDKEGKTAYEVKYADRAAPIVFFPKIQPISLCLQKMSGQLLYVISTQKRIALI